MQGVGMSPPELSRQPAAALVVLAAEVALLVAGRVWRVIRGAVVTVGRRGQAWAVRGAWGMGQLAAPGARPAFAGPQPVPPGLAGFHPAPWSGTTDPRELALPADPTAPRQARALLQAAARDWEVEEDLYQDAAIVVTELVANAVDHARTPSTLTVGWDERGLCVAVRDAHAGPVPRALPVDPTAPRGRGLQMIAALATTWGVTTHVDGKTVWAVLPRH